MPRAKGSSKKGQTKTADAKELNSVPEEVGNQLIIDDATLTNGSKIDEELKEKEVQVPKRSGRSGKKEEKVVVTEEEVPKKKPAAKGRGKKKADENEVIENEIDSQIENKETEVEAANKEELVTKSRGRGKKAAVTTKKSNTSKETDIETLKSAEESVNAKPLEDAKVAEKKSRTSGGRKKKEEVKKEEPVVAETETIPEPTKEKAKKSSRNSKKIVENLEEEPSKEEPPKKRGRASKKDVSVEKIVESPKSAEPEPEIKPDTTEKKPDTTEKKPAKRGRAAASKAASKIEDNQENTTAEEVLPKKRPRKAPSVEKEIVEEKPKKGGRGKKKADKPEEDVQIQGKEEIETNGKDTLENIKEIEEPQTSNKKAGKKPAVAAATTSTTTARGGRKRAAPSTNKQKTAADEDNEEDNELEQLEDEADGSKPSKTKNRKSDSAPLNATTTKYDKADFDLAPLPEGQTADVPRFNLKISSWNVAGLRSWLKKEGLKYLEYEQPDIFCMQETKCTTDQLPEEVQRIPGYHPYWLCMPGGYAGVAIYSKIMPINVEYGIGNKEFDDSGRIITAEYEKFFLVNAYVPNSGRKLVNLEARMKWEKLFQEFIQNLNDRKPVVICGDMNVSHQEHDLANPKSNTRSAGFTKEERDKMSELLSLGYIDTFRHLYPERKGAYTFWTYMGNARSRNVGWRLDYFIVSERFIKRVVDNCIRSQCMGSDHCPITLYLKL